MLCPHIYHNLSTSEEITRSGSTAGLTEQKGEPVGNFSLELYLFLKRDVGRGEQGEEYHSLRTAE